MYILYQFTSLSLNNDAVGAPHIHTCTHTYRNVITCTCTCKRPPCICIHVHSLIDASTNPSYNRHYLHTSGISRTCKHPHSHTHTHTWTFFHINSISLTYSNSLTHARTHVFTVSGGIRTTRSWDMPTVPSFRSPRLTTLTRASTVAPSLTNLAAFSAITPS